MLEIIFEKQVRLPRLNLIFSGRNAQKTVSEFDFDYCRCYYTNKIGCMAAKEALISIFSKTINDPITYGNIRKNRILKALQYGYVFNRRFWRQKRNLIPTRKNYLETVQFVQ